MAFDLEIGTATVFMEASGEPEEGQVAVAHVLCNRASDKRWGGSVVSVCLWPSQFSSWNTTSPDRERLAKTPDNDQILINIKKIMDDALCGLSQDPTGGAKFYYNPSVCKPAWAANFIKTASIGNHDFYKEPDQKDIEPCPSSITSTDA